MASVVDDLREIGFRELLRLREEAHDMVQDLRTQITDAITRGKDGALLPAEEFKALKASEAYWDNRHRAIKAAIKEHRQDQDQAAVKCWSLARQILSPEQIRGIEQKVYRQ